MKAKTFDNLGGLVFASSLVPLYFNLVLVGFSMWGVAIVLLVIGDVMSPNGLLSGPHEKDLAAYRAKKKVSGGSK